ncbi:MAG: hypothetical protein ACK5P7_01920 [Bdellovibrio sp.]|jgi:hypothetical protein
MKNVIRAFAVVLVSMLAVQSHAAQARFAFEGLDKAGRPCEISFESGLTSSGQLYLSDVQVSVSPQSDVYLSKNGELSLGDIVYKKQSHLRDLILKQMSREKALFHVQKSHLAVSRIDRSVDKC